MFSSLQGFPKPNIVPVILIFYYLCAEDMLLGIKFPSSLSPVLSCRPLWYHLNYGAMLLLHSILNYLITLQENMHSYGLSVQENLEILK